MKKSKAMKRETKFHIQQTKFGTCFDICFAQLDFKHAILTGLFIITLNRKHAGTAGTVRRVKQSFIKNQIKSI